jgi:hypothetical protein
MSSIGQIQQGQAAKTAAEYNAQVGEIQAADAYERGEFQKQLLAQDYLRAKGEGRAQIGSSGVRLDTGSSLDWERDLSETFVADRATIDENVSREVYGIRSQQRLDRLQGESAQTASMFGAGASLLSGAGTAAGYWYNR